MPRAERHRVYLGGRPAAQMAAGVLLVALLMLTIDAPVYHALNALGDEVTDRLGALFFFGDSKWYLVPLGVGLLVLSGLRRLAWRPRYRAALGWGTWLCTFGFVAIASSGLLAAGLKYAIGRARPKLFDDLGPFTFQHCPRATPTRSSFWA
jgi:hypothetical protein